MSQISVGFGRKAQVLQAFTDKNIEAPTGVAGTILGIPFYGGSDIRA
jgi:hypothetical protein